MLQIWVIMGKIMQISEFLFNYNKQTKMKENMAYIAILYYSII